MGGYGSTTMQHASHVTDRGLNDYVIIGEDITENTSTKYLEFILNPYWHRRASPYF
jgi:hypothetical protein